MINNINLSSSGANSNNQFSSILDAISSPVILLYGDNIIHFNRAAADFCGLGSKNPPSIKTLFDIDDEQNLIAFNKLSKRLAEGRNFNKQEVLLRISTKPDHLVKGNFKTVYLNNNKFVMLELDKFSRGSSFSNILSGELDNNIFCEISLPMCIVNAELELTNYNKAFMNLFSINEKNNFDKFFLLKILPNRAKRAFAETVEGLINRTDKNRGDFDTILNKDNAGELYLNIEVISSDDSTNWIMIIKDQTREIQLFKDLEKSNKQAKNLKSIFVAQMSHEIRTPINAILSFANLIKEELSEKLPPDIESGFEVINRGGERIIRTINLILDTSEVMTDSYEFFPSELNLFTDVFNEVFMKYKKIAKEKNIDCTYQRETDNLIFTGDEYMTKQIFRNIFDNSVKFTNSGTIDTKIYKDSDDKLAVEISDSGIGMTQEYIDRVFEPFTQEDEGFKRRYEGNGLGLTLTKSYCDINDIDIRITSDKSKGTTVKLVFQNTVQEIPFIYEDVRKASARDAGN